MMDTINKERKFFDELSGIYRFDSYKEFQDYFRDIYNIHVALNDSASLWSVRTILSQFKDKTVIVENNNEIILKFSDILPICVMQYNYATSKLDVCIYYYSGGNTVPMHTMCMPL